MRKSELFQMSRRALAASALAGGASFALGMGRAFAAKPAATGGLLNARKFGAKGNGKADDTKAIQNAIDAAAEKRAAVFLPPGTYLSSEIRLRPNVALTGIAAWDYHRGGGSVLKLIDPHARSLLNITEGTGVTLDGLSLEGDNLGNGIHGIFLDKPNPGRHEDAFRIERCQVLRFTGDGLRLNHAWCWSLRHSMLGYNHGDGVRLAGWDGFVMDNWFSGNKGAGFAARDANAAITLTANRIEWNREGILVMGGGEYNITGNYLDRAGTESIALVPRAGHRCSQMSITGNFLNRSGKDADPDSYKSSQLRIEQAAGITFTGNTLHVGRDDNGAGRWSPSYGIIYKNLENCLITNNTLHEGAIKQLVLDLGSHGEGVIVKDNPGSLYHP